MELKYPCTFFLLWKFINHFHNLFICLTLIIRMEFKYPCKIIFFLNSGYHIGYKLELSPVRIRPCWANNKKTGTDQSFCKANFNHLAFLLRLAALMLLLRLAVLRLLLRLAVLRLLLRPAV